MNSTNNETSLPIINCSLQGRVYESTYLFFKSLNSTYLRLLIGPGILLNLLCLFILSRPRLSNKSTTIIFLRFLALFDILSITLKYIRAEMNYQSLEKGHEIFLLTPSVCKALYVSMNACISIAMWTIVLMSLDKAVAVSYPLKSSLITAANIVIAVVLHRTSYDWRISNESTKRESDSSLCKSNKSKLSLRQRCSGSSTTTAAELVLATKRRTNAQVTRMLLAVTLSLILFNIPNTIFFVAVKIYDTRQLLLGRSCVDISDGDIVLYKLGFYSSVIQDILSDLPHVVNFFLYCLAGKKFRSIFINEFHQLLVDLHLMKPKERRLTHGTSIINPELISSIAYCNNVERVSPKPAPSKVRQSVEVLFNGKKALTILNRQNENLSKKKINRSKGNQKCFRSNTSKQ
ncbi:unnamed protein product [Rotaria sp. Silwood1]|nr:unnamed protein product [Rotaria sp. Silwood1]CAF0914313.1 unnamed protein product [Rotaria sp. Silwood1]CAF0940939.1 unnamed protein product [Rotaria sp. Silwood1]CAF3359026.1 unnamed protein product [Rotaria sp. Silwood1]CAF3382457.1 unnamed protein product [Rotaria sp. Silwood1]